VAPGHTRPITHLSFSPIQDDGTFLLISSCKDGNPMLREWTGDWIGTFLGHKGAVWSTKLSLDSSRAASGSADFTAYVIFSTLASIVLIRCHLGKSGIHILATVSIPSPIITSSAVSLCPHRRPTCSRAGRRRKSAYLTSTDRMQNLIFCVTMVPCPMRVP